MRSNRCNGLESVLTLGDDLDVRNPCKQRYQSLPGKRLVVQTVLVTCPACRELIATARAVKENGT